MTGAPVAPSARAEVDRPGGPHWFSRVEAPIAHSGSWDDEADIVIVGLGGAGVCAAIEALDAGASVIAIDRFAGGGATRMSGGIHYAGGGTRQQNEAGVADDPDNMFDYLRMEVEDAVDTQTLRRFCEDSREQSEWLERQGVRFDSSLSPVKTSYPGKGYFLYYSGNEAQADYKAHARPAQRGHRTWGTHLTGHRLFDPLLQSAIAKGLRIYSYSDARRLVVDKAGGVAGVEILNVEASSKAGKALAKLNRKFARPITYLFSSIGASIIREANLISETEGRTRRIGARKGVILAAGGYVQNRDMVRHYASSFLGAVPLGGIGCDGSGIRLGQSVGGQAARMERMSAWRQFQPPVALAQGIIVDAHGNRFVAEDCYGAKVGHEIAAREGSKAYIILDATLRGKALRQAMPGSGRLFRLQCVPAIAAMTLGATKGATLSELAQRCGMDAAALAASVEHNNHVAQGTEAARYNKDPMFLAAITKPPFYAVDISIGSKQFLCPSISLGGLMVDQAKGQVLDSNGEPIPRLYAAGKTAVGISSNYYVSGLSLADAVFSGRTAGRSAATS